MRHRIGTLVAGAFALAWAASCPAATCVTDVPGFRAALALANGSTTQTTIMVARGTYDLSPGQLNFVSGAADQGRVDIAGGYNQDCSTHLNNPALTVLDGGHQSQVLNLSGAGGFSLRYLTVQNGSSSSSAALSVSSSKEIIVDYNIIRDNSVTGDGSRFAGVAVATNITGDIRFDGNLLFGNTADLSEAAGAISTSGSGHIYVTNNTVAGNAVVAGRVGGLTIGAVDPGIVDISNNIFWNNGDVDLFVYGSVTLTANDIGAFDSPDFPSEFGDLSLDPKFNPGAYSLAANSPLTSQGDMTPPGGLPTIDIEGHPRSYLGLVDMGAYERGDKLFDNDFDH